MEYNWRAIFIGAIPMSLVIMIVFYYQVAGNVKWFYMLLAMAAAFGITFHMDRKGKNGFTSTLIVLIAAYIMHYLRYLRIF